MCGGTVNTRSHALAIWIIGGVPPVSLSSMFSKYNMTALEDIERQVLTYGERKPLEQFLNAVVDEITLNDITKISRKIISPPLTMASYGDGIIDLVSTSVKK
ncbi:putative mitochondrial-processing peptidase subunit alpha-1, mitochondrial [Glycine max]|nr:putative mitochondrial-processing peptidase subunit alpha-1, mitochondrial [Glycine max]